MSKYEKTIYFMMILLIYLCIMPFALGALFRIIDINFGDDNLNQVYVLFITPFLCSFLPGLFYFIVTRDNLKETLSIKRLSIKNFFLIVLMAFLMQPAASFIAALSSVFFDNTVSSVMTSISETPPFTLIFVVAFLPAVFEELMYRGIILSGCKNAGVVQSAVISGLFFGIMHLNCNQFFYAFLLGVILGLFVIYTGSIFASMTAHFVINASQCFLVIISNKIMNSFPEIAVQAETAKVTFGELVFVGGIAVIFGTLFMMVFLYFLKINKSNVKNISMYEKPRRLINIPFIVIIVIFALYSVGMEVLNNMIGVRG